MVDRIGWWVWLQHWFVALLDCSIDLQHLFSFLVVAYSSGFELVLGTRLQLWFEALVYSIGLQHW